MAHNSLTTWVIFLLLPFFYLCSCLQTPKNSPVDLPKLREKVKKMFNHAYDNYIHHAFPKDELQPITCQGRDTWGSFSLTLIDSLDTLLMLNNKTEFARVSTFLAETLNFDYDFNVSVFESNIRVLGGLISAHILAGSHVPRHLFNDIGKSKMLPNGQKISLEIVPDTWPCQGRLLDLAVEIADKLLPAFDTKTGMPYGTVNLKHGVPKGETTVTCTACIGTFLIEFGALSILTGNDKYLKSADKASDQLFAHRSSIDLVGNHLDISTGRWVAQEAGIGGAIDSYFEYLVKASILFKNSKYFDQFEVYKQAIDSLIKTKTGMYVQVNMNNGNTIETSMESLSNFYPGVETLYSDLKSSLDSVKKLSKIASDWGGFPEMFLTDQNLPKLNRDGYPLRPELIEAIWYLWRSTRNPNLLEIAENLLHSIEQLAKTNCGYATIKSVTTQKLEDRMESFFLAETLKYFYLIFDEDNFLNDQDENNFYHKGDIFRPNSETTCILNAGGYIFNTEAHPIDPGISCCQKFWHGDNEKILLQQLKLNLKAQKSQVKQQAINLNKFKYKSSQTYRIVLEIN